MIRLRLALLLVAVVALAGVGELWRRAVSSFALVDQMERERLAARVIDSMEAELSDILAREEARSVLDWRTESVRGGQFVRSPLADAPDDAAIAGYLEIGPDLVASYPRQGAEPADEGVARDERSRLDRLAAPWRAGLEASFVAMPDELVVEGRQGDDLGDDEGDARPSGAKAGDRVGAREEPVPAGTVEPAPILEAVTTKASAIVGKPVPTTPEPTKELVPQPREEERWVEEKKVSSVGKDKAKQDLVSIEASLNKGASKRSQRVSRQESIELDNAGSYQVAQAAESMPAPQRKGGPAPESQAASWSQGPPVVEGGEVGSGNEGRMEAGGVEGNVVAKADARAGEDLRGIVDAAAADDVEGGDSGGDSSRRRDSGAGGELAQSPSLAPGGVDAGPPGEDGRRDKETTGTLEAAVSPDRDTGDGSAAAGLASGSARSPDGRSTSPAPSRGRSGRRVERAEPMADEVGSLDVELSPFGATVVPGGLVLARTVRAGLGTWRQAVVLELAALRGRLERSTLDAGLRGVVELDWDGDGAGDLIAHTFAAPFDSLRLGVNVGELPRPGTDPTVLATRLAVALAVALLVGLLAVERMTSVVVAFAQRRSDFVSAVSHELKTPLTSLRMYAEMLDMGMVLDEERRASYYRTLRAESERLARLVEQVLELSRLEKGTRTLRWEMGPIDPVLDDVAALLRPGAGELGFEVAVEVEPGLPALRYDRDAVVQILLNLSDNAMKFARKAEDRRIHLVARTEEGAVCVGVRDHGPGVPRDQLRRIFEPFYRGERELVRETKGTGIGLAVVRGLARGMGGEVQARNAEDGGLWVRVGLRAAEA